jgi:hypothetical protein
MYMYYSNYTLYVCTKFRVLVDHVQVVHGSIWTANPGTRSTDLLQLYRYLGTRVLNLVLTARSTAVVQLCTLVDLRTAVHTRGVRHKGAILKVVELL